MFTYGSSASCRPSSECWFSELIKVPVRDNYLEIPKAMGEGYVRKVGFGDDFRLTIYRYALKEDLIIKRNPAAISNNVRTIFSIMTGIMKLNLVTTSATALKNKGPGESVCKVKGALNTLTDHLFIALLSVCS